MNLWIERIDSFQFPVAIFTVHYRPVVMVHIFILMTRLGNRSERLQKNWTSRKYKKVYEMKSRGNEKKKKLQKHKEPEWSVVLTYVHSFFCSQFSILLCRFSSSIFGLMKFSFLLLFLFRNRRKRHIVSRMLVPIPPWQ